MEVHTSTAERLPILGEFFKTTLAPIAPVSSILDLACGLNPLAIPWMPLSNEFKYLACDIYCDMMGFIQSFFYHFLICGKAFPADIIDAGPTQTSQVAFLLKALPCLEQLDKAIGAHLLENIQADHILISFPVRSLGGHHKGMPNFYRNHFFELVAGKNWKIHEFSFDTELAFLVTK